MQRKGRPLTEGEIKWVESQRRIGKSWRKIGQKLHMGRDQVRNQCDPNRIDYMRFRTHCRPEPRPVIPQSVLAERERAYAPYESVYVALLGDPRVGRSALDKRNGLE